MLFFLYGRFLCSSIIIVILHSTDLFSSHMAPSLLTITFFSFLWYFQTSFLSALFYNLVNHFFFHSILPLSPSITSSGQKSSPFSGSFILPLLGLLLSPTLLLIPTTFTHTSQPYSLPFIHSTIRFLFSLLLPFLHTFAPSIPPLFHLSLTLQQPTKGFSFYNTVIIAHKRKIA